MKKISIVYNSKRVFTRKFIYAIWGVLILIAKYLRYTVLKQTLVDNSIGHTFIRMMKYETLQFDLFESFSQTTDSSQNAALIYKVLNVLGLETYVQFEILISLVGNIVFILLLTKVVDKIDDLQFLYLSILIIALNIFDFCLSKEPIQIFLFLVLACIIWKYSEKETKCVLLLTIYIIFMSVTFRTYFLLMLPFAAYVLLVYKWYLKSRNLCRTTIAMVVGAGIIYMLLLMVTSQISPSIFTELIRVRNRVVPAKTRILQVISGADNVFLHTLNYLVVVLRLLFPIELVHLGIQYSLYFVAQLVITLVYLKAIISAEESDTICNFAVVIYTSFLLMSAVHEIEFGSWVRHEVAIVPILVMMGGHKARSR